MKTGFSVAMALLLAGAAHGQQAADAVAPEAATTGVDAGFENVSQAAKDALAAKEAGQPVAAQNWMVAAANPLAVEAGAKVLEAGAVPPMRWWRFRSCWVWSSRKAAAWAAGPFWFIMMPKAAS